MNVTMARERTRKITCKHDLLILAVKCFILPLYCLVSSHSIMAEIKFEEATQDARINHSSSTYGASWGDINGDGWPDLWVGNHNSKPSMYLNNRDGTFTNIIDKVWSGNPGADKHGAAWADFDNDGDQDLVELVGASTNEDGTLCIGCGRNHLYVNQGGVLEEKAKAYGLDQAGLARSPLWIDVDRDGKLDLVTVNTRRKGLSPTSVFMQKNKRFKDATEASGLRDSKWTRRDKILATYRNLKRFEFTTKTSFINSHNHLEAAQLARISKNDDLDLVLLSSPTRIFSLDDKEFDDETSSYKIPGRNGISDVAIEDFNGDGKNDMYLLKGPFLESDVIRVSANEIKATLTGRRANKHNMITFRAKGTLEFRMGPAWLALDRIFIGANGHHPDALTFTLSPDDDVARGPGYAKLAEKNKSLSIVYNPEKAIWEIRNLSSAVYTDFTIKADQAIEDLETIGFIPFKERGVDTILIRQDDKFVPMKLKGDIGGDTSCYSIVAADFDNDMDVDLYMVCTGPVANIPNRLFENDGDGNFRLVPDAGGAAGSHMGRGDVAAVADYNRDGFLDIFVTNGTDPAGQFSDEGPHQLFRNQGNNNRWIEIDLEGVKSNRDGIGASVVVEAGGVRQVREQRGGMHRITQNHQRLHFGLGSNNQVDRLVVNWPSGTVQEIRNISASRIVTIREQQGLSELDN